MQELSFRQLHNAYAMIYHNEHTAINRIDNTVGDINDALAPRLSWLPPLPHIFPHYANMMALYEEQAEEARIDAAWRRLLLPPVTYS